jgi:hypothetical protein
MAYSCAEDGRATEALEGIPVLKLMNMNQRMSTLHADFGPIRKSLETENI